MAGRARRRAAREEATPARQPGPSAEDPDAVEAAFLAVLAAAAAASLLAVLLAQLGRFSAAACAVAGLVAGAAFARGLGWARPQLAGFVPLLVALPLLPALAAPSEWVLGHRDPGYYVHTAVTIARTGALQGRDDFMPRMDADVRGAFLEQLRPTDPVQRFRGVPFADDAMDRTVPLFMPLPSATMAIGSAVGGLSLALRSPALHALLGVLATFFLTRRLLGAGAAAVAALLLALGPAEQWLARLPLAETHAQCWTLAGLAALVRYREDGERGVAILAGAAFGLAGLARAESLLLAPFVAVVLVLAARAATRPAWPLLSGLLPPTAVAIAYAATLGRTYVRFVLDHTPPARLLAGAALASLLVLPFAGRLLARAAAHESHLRRAAAAVAGVAALLLAGTRWPSFVALSWYVSPVVLLAAAAGLAFLLLRHPLGLTWPWLALALPALAQLLHEPAVSTDYHWAIRRFVPLALPSVFVLAVAAAEWWPGARAAARTALAVVAGLWILAAARPIFEHVEYEGAQRQVDDLARRLGPHSLIALAPAPQAYTIALPLQRSGVETLVLQEPEAPPAFVSQVARWRADGYRVFVAAPPRGRFPFAVPGLHARDGFEWRLSVPEMERATDRLPQHARTVTFALQVAELE